GGYSAMVNMQSWMFLTSYEELRKKVLRTKTILSMIHIGARGFDSIGGEVVSTTAFVSNSIAEKDYLGQYIRITDGQNEREKTKQLSYVLRADSEKKNYFEIKPSILNKIPGKLFFYWISEQMVHIFEVGRPLSPDCRPTQGLASGDNGRFVRIWHEVSLFNTKFDSYSSLSASQSKMKWFPFNKGGDYRKWYGNNDCVVNWKDDGFEIRHNFGKNGKLASRPQNTGFYFRESVTWSKIATRKIAFRYKPKGHIFADAGLSLFSDDIQLLKRNMGLLNSCVAMEILRAISPTINFEVGQIASVPIIHDSRKNESVIHIVDENIFVSKQDWDSFENSWDFKEHPLVGYSKALWDGAGIAAHIDHYYGKHMPVSCPLELCFLLWQGECNERFSQLKANEEELNRIFIDIYGLQDELTPEEDDSDVTVRKADLKRDMQSFVSYAVGCMFGRYSLDYEGLAYAGGEWDASRYSSFVPDDDNVIPVLDDEWFSDDIVAKFKKFVKVVFGPESYDANLRYIEKALGKSLRDYFTKDFYSNHLKIYQKRPIYWMFSSPGGSFNALVYLHRYNKNTVDVVLRYLRDYRTKIQAQIKVLKGNGDAQSMKELIRYEKIDKDLDEYDQMLYSLALKHVELNLDDGVKVNYGKLGRALYPVDGLNREKK
ncbi:MAG: BREX-1 system adenine-specific DNA-methyltransferase PglX, partial [Spirochaetales bacterium]|nr:BREX-1 system adenine-specific DNA-methyltransferase PglX [Spirochaetales bacterium]